MSTNSGIEWTEATWNPVTGCTRVSPGCDHCYAVTMTNRLEAMGQSKYAGLTVVNGKGDRQFNGQVRTHDDALTIPMRWKKPRRVFVNSMSDLFHRDVPFEFIDRMFAVMALCPQHTFQVLTKRPERMAEYLARRVEQDDGWPVGSGARYGIGRVIENWSGGTSEPLNKLPVWNEAVGLTIAQHLQDLQPLTPWPLPNVWLGTSIENQQAAYERVSDLLKCPAAARFCSCEPLLGSIDLRVEVLSFSNSLGGPVETCLNEIPEGIHWLIIGCESNGTRAGRFADGYADAARSLISQGRAAGVPVFHKQMPINGCVSHDPAEWPEWARVREFPRPQTARVA